MATPLILLLLAGSACAGGRDVTPFPPPAPPAAEGSEADQVSTEALARFVIGLTLQEEEQHQAALREFARAIEVGGGSAMIHLAMVESFLALGDLDRAEQSAREAELAGGKEKEASLTIARIRFLRGEPVQGAKALERARDADPEDFRVRFELGLLYRRLGQDSLALAELQAAHDLGGEGIEDPQARLNLARSLERLGDEARAREGYELIAEQQGEVEALLGLARIAQREGDFRGALDYYERAYQRDPTDDAVRRHLVRLSVLMEDLDQAVGIAKQVLRMDPSDLQTGVLVAGMLAEKGRMDEAEQVLDSLLNGGESSALVRTLRGRIQLSRGDEGAALREFQAAVDLEPDMPEPLAMLAMIRVQRGEGEMAESLLVRAAAEAPDNPEVHYLLGLARNQMERFEEAIPAFERSLGLRPDDPRTLFEAGVAYERTDRVEKAEASFEKLLEIEPDNAMAHNYLGYMLADRGLRLEKSLRHVEEAVAREPDNGYFVDSLGWVYYRLGDYQNATIALERAISLVDQGDIRAHLAEVYEKRGMLAKARENWERAVELEPDNAEWREQLESLGSGGH